VKGESTDNRTHFLGRLPGGSHLSSRMDGKPTFTQTISQVDALFCVDRFPVAMVVNSDRRARGLTTRTL